MDALRSWVMRTGIDGFRFDLATVMGRTPQGFSTAAPLLAAIEQDPLLSRLIMIAEPWDVGPGGYQLGALSGALAGMERPLPRRGAPLLARRGLCRRRLRHAACRLLRHLRRRHRPPSAGINFIAAHDGFTLRDAVTYAVKDNHANGEDNRDGNAHEPTWPGGDVRALLATLFLSRGTPMLTAGDEFGRTQGGNNNAYAQDNAITWLDWEKADQRLIGFTAALAELRRALAAFFPDRYLTGEAEDGRAFPMRNGSAPMAAPWRGTTADLSVLGLLLSAGTQAAGPGVQSRAARVDLALPRARRPSLDAARSAPPRAPDVPPASVAVFAEERIADVGRRR